MVASLDFTVQSKVKSVHCEPAGEIYGKAGVAFGRRIAVSLLQD